MPGDQRIGQEPSEDRAETGFLAVAKWDALDTGTRLTDLITWRITL